MSKTTKKHAAVNESDTKHGKQLRAIVMNHPKITRADARLLLQKSPYKLSHCVADDAVRNKVRGKKPGTMDTVMGRSGVKVNPKTGFLELIHRKVESSK